MPNDGSSVDPVVKVALKPIVTKPDKAKPSEDIEGDSTPVSPVGRLFLDPEFYTTIICVLEFQNPVDLERMRGALEGSLAQHPRFRSRVIYPPGKCGQPAPPVWTPCHVDISCHVFLAQLSEEEKRSANRVAEYAARLSSAEPLDQSKPLWECHVINSEEGQQGSPRGAMVLRIHHSLGDGTSLMSLLLACTRRADNPSLLPTLPRPGGMSRGQLAITGQQKTTVPGADPGTDSGGARKEGEENGPVIASEELRKAVEEEGGSSRNDSDGGTGGSAASLSTAPPPTATAAPPPATAAPPPSTAAPHVHIPSEPSTVTLETLAGRTNGQSNAGNRNGRPPAQYPLLLRPFIFLCRVLTVAFNTLLHILQFLAMVAVVKDSPTPIKGSNDVDKKPRQMTWSDPMSLDDVSIIRKSVNGTFNDVMLAVIAGGIHLYLKHLQGKEEEGKGKASLSRRLRVRGLALVNLRKAPGLHELETMMKDHKAASSAPWGNHLGNLLLPLPVQDLPSPLVRLRLVKKMCDAKKLSLEGHWSYMNGRIIMATAGMKTVSTLMRRSLNHTSLSLSNMLGPIETVTLAGNPISAISPTVVGHPHALTCHMQSYNGSVKVVVSAATVNVPDPSVLCRFFLESFQQLLKEAAAINGC